MLGGRVPFAAGLVMVPAAPALPVATCSAGTAKPPVPIYLSY